MVLESGGLHHKRRISKGKRSRCFDVCLGIIDARQVSTWQNKRLDSYNLDGKPRECLFSKKKMISGRVGGENPMWKGRGFS